MKREERFIADGRQRLEESSGCREAHAAAVAAVRARYAEPLARAGFLRRIALRMRMRREIAEEVAKLAPPEAFYFRA